jgi:hypothetical protein
MKQGEISLRLESGALHQQNTLWIHHQQIWINQKGYVIPQTLNSATIVDDSPSNLDSSTLKTIKHIGLIINQ